jgi:hypothetical protein
MPRQRRLRLRQSPEIWPDEEKGGPRNRALFYAWEIGTPGSSLAVRIVNDVLTLLTLGADVSFEVRNS